MFNYWHQGKVVFLSEIDNTVCRLDCRKKLSVVDTYIERGLVHQVFTSEGKSGSVYIPVTQEASVMAKVRSIARLPSIYNLFYIPFGAGYGQAWTLSSD